MEQSNQWGFERVWNDSLMRTEERPVTPRDYLWASELGKAPIDLFLRLKGVIPTNPPNPRSMRKFEAGNVFEWIVSLVLKRAGILKEAQHRGEFTYPGLLRVSGKGDFVAGGKPDIEKFKAEMDSLELPEVFTRAGEAVMKYLAESYPNGLEDMPLEIKSVSAFMYEGLEKRRTGSKNHRMQLFHSLKSHGWKRGNLVYICRDDLRMLEIPVLNSSKFEDEYKKELEIISDYVKRDVQPEKEDLIFFDEDLGKFVRNWNVAYSGYLTMLYGFQTQAEYDDKYMPVCARWNRVLGRIKKQEKMTPKNLIVLDEMRAEGFNPDEMSAKYSGGEVEEETV